MNTTEVVKDQRLVELTCPGDGPARAAREALGLERHSCSPDQTLPGSVRGGGTGLQGQLALTVSGGRRLNGGFEHSLHLRGASNHVSRLDPLCDGDRSGNAVATRGGLAG